MFRLSNFCFRRVKSTNNHFERCTSHANSPDIFSSNYSRRFLSRSLVSCSLKKFNSNKSNQINFFQVLTIFSLKKMKIPLKSSWLDLNATRLPAILYFTNKKKIGRNLKKTKKHFRSMNESKKIQFSINCCSQLHRIIQFKFKWNRNFYLKKI